MNICAKINSIASPDGLVIGERLFEMVKAMEGYNFIRAERGIVAAGLQGVKGDYAVYHVEEKEKRSIINPFEIGPAS